MRAFKDLKGRLSESRILEKAIRISENIKDRYPYQLTLEMEKRLEIKRNQPAHPLNLTRASVHKIGNIGNLKALLKKKKEVEGVDYIIISIAGKKRKFPNDPKTWRLSLKQFNAMTMEELEKALELGFESI